MNKINLNHPDILKLAPEKQELLHNISEQIKQMPTNNSMSYMIALVSQLKMHKVSFSNDEIHMLIRVLSEDLNPSEKLRLDSILKLF